MILSNSLRNSATLDVVSRLIEVYLRRINQTSKIWRIHRWSTWSKWRWLIKLLVWYKAEGDFARCVLIAQLFWVGALNSCVRGHLIAVQKVSFRLLQRRDVGIALVCSQQVEFLGVVMIEFLIHWQRCEWALIHQHLCFGGRVAQGLST